MKKITLLLVALTLFGCKEIELFSRPDVVYRIESDGSAADIERSANVLISRLDEFREGPLSKIILNKRKDGFFLTFRRGSPSASLILEMASIQGNFEGGFPSGRSRILSNADIANAQATVEDGTVYINIVLTSEAGERFNKITTDNVGKMFAFYMDSQQLSAARINTPLGQYFRISYGDAQDATLHAVLLRSGSLHTKLHLHRVN